MSLTTILVGVLYFAEFHSGNKILSFMDPSVDPCTDFYQFSCGTMLKDEKLISASLEVYNLMSKQLRDLLTSRDVSDLPAAFAKAQNYYKGCMNEDVIEKKSLAFMNKTLGRYGGWPVVTPNWKEDTFDWINMTGLLAHDGHANNLIADLTVEALPTNTKITTLQLTKANLGISIDYLLTGIDDPICQAYYEYMVDVAVEFGASKVQAEEDMTEVFQFESKLAQIEEYEDWSALNEDIPRSMAISELQAEFPFIAWTSFIKAVMGDYVEFVTSDSIERNSKGDQVPSNFLGSGALRKRITNNDESLSSADRKFSVLNNGSFEELGKIYVLRPTYFLRLGPLLRNTPKRVIANYMLWRVLQESAPYLTKKMRQLEHTFLEKKYGPYDNPRQQECSDEVNSEKFDAVVGSAYLHRYSKPGTREKAMEVVRLFQSQLAAVLSSVPWMDDQTRAEAVRKVKNTYLSIGYPDELLDYNVINYYYQNLETHQYDWYSNEFTVRKWKRNMKTLNLLYAFNKTDWQYYSYITDVNAGYDDINAVVIRYGMLVNSYFSADRPVYMNLGTLLYIGGHELTHSIDSFGARYDADGNLRNWWSKESLERLSERVEQISAEYSSYFVKEANMSLRGDQLALEVTADHGAVRIGHLALEEWLSQHPDQESSRIAGLEEFTPRQVFWLSNAVVKCESYSLEYLIQMIRTDSHPPTQYRINVPYRNSPDFAVDWNCPVDSYMNKKDKVNVW